MRDELSRDLGRDPADHEIGHALGIGEGDVVDLFRLSKDAASLEAPLNDTEGIRVANTVVDERRRSPEEEVDRQRAQQAMIDGLGSLPERQTRILAYRYGLADGTPRSRPWIGKKLGLSAERVRQLERSALKTLRTDLEAAA